MKRVGSYNQYGGNTSYYRNRTYGRRINKKRMTIFIVILAIGLIVLFTCIGNAVAENKKNEKIQQLTEYGMKQFKEVTLPTHLEEMRKCGIDDLTAELQIDNMWGRGYDSKNNELNLGYTINYFSSSIDNYYTSEYESNSAKDLTRIMKTMIPIRKTMDSHEFDNYTYSYALENVGTVIIHIYVSESSFEIASSKHVYDLNFVGGYSLSIDEDFVLIEGTSSSPSNGLSASQVWNYCADRQYEYFVAGGMTDSQIEQQAYEDAANHFGISVSEVKRLYQEHANSLLGSSSGTSGKKNKCVQCGKPIYADETWCDDCLFGSIGGTSYDLDYQSNLEDIADAYGVTPKEVNAKIKAVTGE